MKIFGLKMQTFPQYTREGRKNGKKMSAAGRANNIFTLIQSIIEVVISSRYCINKMDDRFNEGLRNFCYINIRGVLG